MGEMVSFSATGNERGIVFAFKSPLDRARERFGGPFALENGTTWKPKATPVLTRWLAKDDWRNRT